MLVRHAASHVDHDLTEAQMEFILKSLTDKNEFFMVTFELPPNLGQTTCGLYGPLMGDPPIKDYEVTLEKRGNREYTSRLINKPTRPTTTVSVIGGPHEGHPCILFTAFGGPIAPREPGDPSLETDEARARAMEFWKDHALAK